MKVSISNLAWDNYDSEKINNFLKEQKYSGLEIAPSVLFPEQTYEHINDAKNWKDNIYQNYGFEISSMQSIWYGRKENIFNSKEERDILFEYTKKAIDFASSIGCYNLVFGCPKNRNINNNPYNEKDIMEFFKSICDYSESKKVYINLEANPKIYNTNFINYTKEAFDFVKKVNHNFFRVNLDLGTMIENSESLDVVSENIDLIRHIHISEPFLKAIERRNIHFELREILKEKKYNGFVSIEMGKQDYDTLVDVIKYIGAVFL